MSEYAFGRPIGKIIHGGDYNPEQWLDRPDILEKDIEYMKQAGVNEATLGVFSWAMYEPREGEFHLEWLHEIMDRLYENGIDLVTGETINGNVTIPGRGNLVVKTVLG